MVWISHLECGKFCGKFSICWSLEVKSKCISEEICPALKTICWAKGRNHWIKSMASVTKLVRLDNHKGLLQSECLLIYSRRQQWKHIVSSNSCCLPEIYRSLHTTALFESPQLWAGVDHPPKYERFKKKKAVINLFLVDCQKRQSGGSTHFTEITTHPFLSLSYYEWPND